MLRYKLPNLSLFIHGYKWMGCVAYVHNRFPVIEKNGYFSYNANIIQGQIYP